MQPSVLVQLGRGSVTLAVGMVGSGQAAGLPHLPFQKLLGCADLGMGVKGPSWV